MRPLCTLSLLLCLAGTVAQAQDANNPYNSAIRNANPNSRQGTAPPAAAPRGLPPQGPTRPPTLENGGIGNGNNLRPAPPLRQPINPVTPSTSPRPSQ